MDLDTIAHVARFYNEAEHTEPTDTELETFRTWLNQAYGEIASFVRFTYQEVDPAQMLLRWRNTKQLLISTAHNDSPWMSKKENARFRAVHDFHHIRYNLAFDVEGEYMAFEAAASEAPIEIHWMLRSEIWFQAAACEFYNGFQQQKLVHTCV